MTKSTDRQSSVPPRDTIGLHLFNCNARFELLSWLRSQMGPEPALRLSGGEIYTALARPDSTINNQLPGLAYIDMVRPDKAKPNQDRIYNVLHSPLWSVMTAVNNAVGTPAPETPLVATGLVCERVAQKVGKRLFGSVVQMNIGLWVAGQPDHQKRYFPRATSEELNGAYTESKIRQKMKKFVELGMLETSIDSGMTNFARTGSPLWDIMTIMREVMPPDFLLPIDPSP